MAPSVRFESQGHKRITSETSNANSAKISEPASQTTSHGESQAAPWRALFFFTTRANLPVLLLGIFTSLCAGAVGAINAYIQGKVFKSFIDLGAGTVTGQQLYDNDKKYVLYFVALAGGSWVLHGVGFFLWVCFGELQAKSARDRLFLSLLEKEVEWYDLRTTGIGALLPRLQAQIRELQLATAQPLGGMLELSSTVVLSLAQAFYYSWDLTFVTIASVPIIMILVFWLNSGMQRAVEMQKVRLGEAQKRTTSAFAAIETVKCYNAQAREARSYAAKIGEAAIYYWQVARINGMQMGALVFLGSAIFVTGFYYGGVLIDKHKKDASQVMTCFLSATSAFQAVRGALPQMLILEKGRSAGATLRKIMAEVDSGATVERQTGALRPAICRGDIEVNDVSFAYPSRPEQLALDNVSMFIQGGEMTFFIGKSGSGKSTLSQLLMRFYSFPSGSITVDGVPLASLDVTWLRQNLTIVEQTSLLFNDTVFRNIAFGHSDPDSVTRSEVMEAIEFALLQLMISDMPEGLDTMVGYKGGAMSGGQRQRMALARVRLRDTPILMLDESTSALDHISRTLVMDALRKWRKGRTTLVITHDISQIQASDYVYVLDSGKLMQEGYRGHMEKEKDTPFQDFLPPELRAVTSAYGQRKDTALTSIYTRGSPIDYESIYSQEVDEMPDPLELELNAGETNRQSYMPGVLVDGSTMSGIGGVAGPTSTFAAPFLRLTVSSPMLAPLITRFTPAFDSWTHTSPESPASPSSTRKSTRFSTMMESLVERTGQQAAAARVASENIGERVRRPVNEVALAKLTGEGASANKQGQDNDGVVQLGLKQILSTVWPNINLATRLVVIMGFVSALVHAIATPCFSYVFSKLLATYSIPTGRGHMTLVYSMSMLGIAAIDGVSTYGFRYLLEYSSQVWVDNLRARAVGRILDQPRSFFDHDINSVALMTENLDRNAEETRNILGRFMGMLLAAAVMVTVSIVWALTASWKFTLICLAAGPYVFLVTNMFSTISGQWETRSADAAEAASAIFSETFTNIKTVRALTLENHFMNRYTMATNYAIKVGFIRAMLSGFFYGLSDSAGTFVTALIFYVGSLLAKEQGPTSVSRLLQVCAILIFTIANVSDCLQYIPQIGASKDTASRLMRLVNLPKDPHEHMGDTRIVSIGDIQFTDLSFAYPSRPEQQVLRELNLRIKPGTSTAVVGGSGSGKSTIANLLLNLYATDTVPGPRGGKLGDLTIAGRDIKHIDTPSLRALVVVVPQMPTLFAATVAENICFGLEDDSPLREHGNMVRAAQSAGIHEFIASLPQGYSTLIGDGGMGVSGGQAQRIAIARALVRNPSVLILDEATSALDVESANLIRNTIQMLLNDRTRSMTVIIITHSREQMEIAEHIVVLDHGVIVEEGGFEELMSKNGALMNLLSGGEWDAEREARVTGRKRRAKVTPKMGDVNWKRRSRARPRLRM